MTYTVDCDHSTRRSLAIFLWKHLDSSHPAITEILELQTIQGLEERWRELQELHALPSIQSACSQGKEIEFECKARNKSILCPGDPLYPPKLYDMHRPPVLCVCGNPGILRSLQIAIVGSRKTIDEANKITPMIADDVICRGFIITSGGALGIDALAHRQAIKRNQPTIVVSATGVDNIYPKENADIFDYAKQNGAIVSQYNKPPQKHRPNFPRRNDIIAALSQATIIIQSKVGGGALYTAKAANRFNRPVLVAAMPGFNDLTEGGWQLVKTQKAKLISDLQDLNALTPQTQKTIHFGTFQERVIPAQKPTITHNNTQLTPTKKNIIELLAKSPMTRDKIRTNTQYPNDFDEAVLELELAGMIQFVAGRYCKP